ncbi:hypothetical protein GMJAKD_17145 [Candidatus Electrothrix aarhusensis]
MFMNSRKKAILIIFSLILNYNFAFAESYNIALEYSNSDCPDAEYSNMYFKSASLDFISVDNNNSKLKITFSASDIAEEDEAYLSIVTLPYNARVTEISYFNLNHTSIAPAQSSSEYQSRIPGAIGSIAQELGNSALPLVLQNFFKKAGLGIQLATAILGEDFIVKLARNRSMLYDLGNIENPIIDSELYPHHSYHEFFTRNSNLVTIITYHINLPINRLMKSIQENKMSIYIGGSRENEMLIEGLSANRFAPNKMLLFLPSIIASKREVSVPTVTSTTGRIWMDRNFGASRVATSMTDEESYGDLYQWGRLADGHEKRTSATIATISSADNPDHGKFILTAPVPSDWRNPQNDDLWQGVDGTNNPCPAGFRPPNESEIQEEIDTWSSKDAAGAFASPLKLPASGIRYCFDGSLDTVGSSGAYWSSSVSDTNARLLDFSGDHAWVSDSIRASGFSLRCIKDEPGLVPTVTSATGRVWMDRNLGASRVATSSADEEAYGDLYQWGRLTDGHEKRTSETTGTLSVADVPSHENFITTPFDPYGNGDWRSSQNDNLWQGVTGVNNPCPVDFRLPTQEELQEERESWSSNDIAGAFSSPLKFPAAGYRNYEGSFSSEGTLGFYWTSSIKGVIAINMTTLGGSAHVYGYNGRANGFSVRCIKN